MVVLWNSGNYILISYIFVSQKILISETKLKYLITKRCVNIIWDKFIYISNNWISSPFHTKTDIWEKEDSKKDEPSQQSTYLSLCKEIPTK